MELLAYSKARKYYNKVFTILDVYNISIPEEQVQFLINNGIFFSEKYKLVIFILKEIRNTYVAFIYGSGSASYVSTFKKDTYVIVSPPLYAELYNKEDWAELHRCTKDGDIVEKARASGDGLYIIHKTELASLLLEQL